MIFLVGKLGKTKIYSEVFILLDRECVSSTSLAIRHFFEWFDRLWFWLKSNKLIISFWTHKIKTLRCNCLKCIRFLMEKRVQAKQSINLWTKKKNGSIKVLHSTCMQWTLRWITTHAMAKNRNRQPSINSNFLGTLELVFFLELGCEPQIL